MSTLKLPPMHPMLGLFLRLTLAIAVAIVAFVIAVSVTAFLVKVVLIAGVVAAVAVGGFFLYSLIRRRAQLPTVK